MRKLINKVGKVFLYIATLALTYCTTQDVELEEIVVSEDDLVRIPDKAFAEYRLLTQLEEASDQHKLPENLLVRQGDKFLLNKTVASSVRAASTSSRTKEPVCKNWRLQVWHQPGKNHLSLV